MQPKGYLPLAARGRPRPSPARPSHGVTAGWTATNRNATPPPERLAALLDASPAVLYSFRAGGDHAPTFVSPNIARLFGYEPGEYLEHPGFWRERVHPDDLPRAEAGFARLLEAGRCACEYRFRRKDGTYRWVEDR